MRYLRLAALACAIGSAALPHVASALSPLRTTAAVLLPVHRFADAFNRGDAKAAAALCTSPASVIDEFPPHSWQGPTACADWAAALANASKLQGVTDARVTLGKAAPLSIDGSTAYAVLPTTFSYRVKGKPTTEHGLWTFALRKTAQGWRIAAWAWARTL